MFTQVIALSVSHSPTNVPAAPLRRVPTNLVNQTTPDDSVPRQEIHTVIPSTAPRVSLKSRTPPTSSVRSPDARSPSAVNRSAPASNALLTNRQ